MPSKRPTILHYKWSLDDGHVMPQIFRVKSYHGILIAREPKRVWKKSPLRSRICPLNELLAHPQKIIKKHNVKAIHIHHATLASKLLFLKTKHKLPMIVGFRGKDATSFARTKKNRRFLRKLFKTANLFLPVCHHLKRRIIRLGCPPKKIKVMYGGVDLTRFRFVPRKYPCSSPVRFLAIGRFVPKKGFGELIEAFAILKKKHKNIHLTLIGEGECLREYKRKIKKHMLQKQVKIVSWVNYQKIQKEYHRAHIFCAPSRTDREGNQEGIPNTLKEAMATGMPCIATYHAGNSEIMKNGKTGLLVPERSVKQLAKAMKKMIKSPQKWEKWGRSARKKIAKDFNLSKQLAKQRRYYNQLLRR